MGRDAQTMGRDAHRSNRKRTIYGIINSSIVEVIYHMMTRDADDYRRQIVYFCIDDLVPANHLLRQIDKAIDWSFIYELVEDKYSANEGRPSMDPVTLIKLPFLQYLYGIRSMRQTIKEIEVNVAYRWFLGLGLYEAPPHFSTFGKNYTRRFKDTDLFEQIFERILQECFRHGFVDSSEVFVDSTHVKARANSHKKRTELARKEAMCYEEKLKEEINRDRAAHGKSPLKAKDDENDESDGDSGRAKEKEIKVSATDPESGWFHKGEHKQVFAYGVSTASDKHGWILGYDVNPGNVHDSRAFCGLYNKLQGMDIKTLIGDSAFKTPPIAKTLLDAGITPVFPYTRPITKEGFFRKHEYVYDEYYDCYLCPNNSVLKYSTTNRKGYREYRSDPKTCRTCPYLSQCTKSANHTKVVTRHIWAEYLETCDDIRHTLGMKKVYKKRKETIERIFGTAKEYHGFRYTQMYGKARMNMKAGLTFACMNLKKLARLLEKKGRPDGTPPQDGASLVRFLRLFARNLIACLIILKSRFMHYNKATLA